MRPEAAWPPRALLRSARDRVKETSSRLGLKLDSETKRAAVQAECIIEDGSKHVRLGGLTVEQIWFIRSRIYGVTARISCLAFPKCRSTAPTFPELSVALFFFKE